jgi:hypothetical protein
MGHEDVCELLKKVSGVHVVLPLAGEIVPKEFEESYAIVLSVPVPVESVL